MIYTLTLNPAVDYFINVKNLVIGAVNRTTNQKINFGGKGINVSRVLKSLGTDSVSLGFVGGFTGDALKDFLTQNGIKNDFVCLEKGNTRINVKLNDTDINAAGPDVSADDIQKLYQKLDNIKNGDILVLSGSAPQSVSKSIYKDIMTLLYPKGVQFAVDAEGDLLLDTLCCKPFLIKPNHHELGAVFGTPINDFDTALFYAEKLQAMGAQNVMVSMGDMGAVLASQEGTAHTCPAPKGKVISAVGSGDSAVAAFLWAYQNGKSYQDCLRYAVAAGSATAFCEGLANAEEIKRLF